MACCAGIGKITCDVIGIGRTVEIWPMTIDTVLMKSCIDIIHMTTCAGNSQMRSNERKYCCCVVKCGWSPHVGIMACETLMRIFSGKMIRILDCIKVRYVARIAILRCRFECIICVALRALNSSVCTSQWKCRHLMIESATPSYGIGKMAL
jgi:hypothetical protein